MAASQDPNPRGLYEFGLRVDPEKELLLREDETVPVAPKAFQVLLVLIRNNGRLVHQGRPSQDHMAGYLRGRGKPSPQYLLLRGLSARAPG